MREHDRSFVSSAHLQQKPPKICTTDHSACSDKLLIVACAMIPTNCAIILQKQHTKRLKPCASVITHSFPIMTRETSVFLTKPQSCLFLIYYDSS